MFRKILSFIVLFVFIFHSFVLANEVENENFELNSIEVSSNTTTAPNINSRYAIVLEKSTETVLFEKAAYTKTAMASTTKIMTAIIALENCDLKEEVNISKKAANTGGSTLGISSNTKLTMKTLLYGLLLRSGNDCAVAIAEHISGNIENFSILMNKKAKELNLVNTSFVTPHGLDAEKHYTTAYDLALLTIYALKNETFAKIVNTKSCSINMNGYSRDINNTHELLGYTDGVYGVKTGFTGNAGRCLVTACKRNDLDVIIVVLGADTKKIRTQDSLNLINYTFNNFKMMDTYDIINSNFKKINYTVNVQNSFSKAKLKLKTKENYLFPININDKDFSTSVYLLNNLVAPLEKESKIGVLKLELNGKTLCENDILNVEFIDKITFDEYFLYVIKKFKDTFI
ncbi:MAG: D-alanyl-D-alanine carboxypeptidase [Clostridia bacterium]|nr:D-alanyl-D-alanine carboxypeptidase [Clostridia bacterium]